MAHSLTLQVGSNFLTFADVLGGRKTGVWTLFNLHFKFQGGRWGRSRSFAFPFQEYSSMVLYRRVGIFPLICRNSLLLILLRLALCNTRCKLPSRLWLFKVLFMFLHLGTSALQKTFSPSRTFLLSLKTSEFGSFLETPWLPQNSKKLTQVFF